MPQVPLCKKEQKRKRCPSELHGRKFRVTVKANVCWLQALMEANCLDGGGPAGPSGGTAVLLLRRSKQDCGDRPGSPDSTAESKGGPVTRSTGPFRYCPLRLGEGPINRVGALITPKAPTVDDVLGLAAGFSQSCVLFQYGQVLCQRTWPRWRFFVNQGRAGPPAQPPVSRPGRRARAAGGQAGQGSDAISFGQAGRSGPRLSSSGQPLAIGQAGAGIRHTQDSIGFGPRPPEADLPAQPPAAGWRRGSSASERAWPGPARMYLIPCPPPGRRRRPMPLLPTLQ